MHPPARPLRKTHLRRTALGKPVEPGRRDCVLYERPHAVRGAVCTRVRARTADYPRYVGGT
eukprot:scaffold73020_cov47-Prasinocladus_malaysianus.AAC.1